VSVVYEPEIRHHCGPNRYGIMADAPSDRPGTVRECSCGKSWVAYRDEFDVGYMGVKWRREGWLARRRRIRNAHG
jgi:hypothetical protein